MKPLIKKLFERWRRFLNEPADDVTLDLFRIFFGFFSFIYAIQSLSFGPYIFFHISDTLKNLVHSVQIIWIISAFLLLVGYRTRLASKLNFFGLATVVNFHIITNGVEGMLFLTTSFWCMFMHLGQNFSVDALLFKKKKEPSSSWPIYFLGVNNGYILFLAGLMKHFDPVWLDGNGFYYTYMLPWIKLNWFDFVLDIRPLMLFLNWSGMIFEILFIFLFFFKKTRWIATLLLATFYAQLAFPLQLGYIGWFGLSMSLCFVSISPPLSNWIHKGLRRFNGIKLKKPGGRLNFSQRQAGVLLGVFILMATLAVDAVSRYRVQYPAALFPLQIHTESGKKLPRSLKYEGFLDSFRWIPFFGDFLVALKSVNSSTMRIQPGLAFSAHHFLGIMQYRIIFELDDKSVREPFKVFNEDKSPSDWSKGLNPRWAQIGMYRITIAAHYLHQNPKSKKIGDRRIPEGLIHLAKKQLSSEDQKRISKAVLLVGHMDMPTKFEGRVSPWEKSGWQVFLTLDYANRTIQINRDMKPLVVDYPVPGLSEKAWMKATP